MRHYKNNKIDTYKGASAILGDNVSSTSCPLVSEKKDETMKEYAYTETEYFILQHLYYSMGVNRMKWHDYKALMIPSIKRKVRLILKDITRSIRKGKDLTQIKYNSYDIDTVIREIKEKFEIFGHYEGYSEVIDSIQRYSWGDK
jgi:hypothetical protein